MRQRLAILAVVMIAVAWMVTTQRTREEPDGTVPSSVEVQHAVESILDRAMDYPYEDVRTSYLFVNGKTYDYTDLGSDPMRDGRVKDDHGALVHVEDFLRGILPEVGGKLPPSINERHAVIAYGSNRAPSALAQNFSNGLSTRHRTAIPVIKAILPDFEVVHAAHYERNGNQPATIQYAAGARAEVFVTFLDDEDLMLMHAAEGLDPASPLSWYHYAKLSDINLQLVGGPTLASAFAYIDNYGATKVNDRTFAVSKVAGQTISAKMSQQEVLDLTRSLVESGDPGLDGAHRCSDMTGARHFLCTSWADTCLRAQRIRALHEKYSAPFAVPSGAIPKYEVISGSTHAGNPANYLGPRCERDPDIG
ncbi:hypothetical protein [Lentzea sp. NEAU-D7]|uniref:hypothetical protein n=1 Tax=Lentzea sp. NEAU-D7 TaxID=2994667 RepID=UPI00224A5A57|nr:hypothetical protein [Lentzea sp. NEAU-D7]MCX2954535.1 hypothetical protein [Lentzea sp. NEAU-D7]